VASFVTHIVGTLALDGFASIPNNGVCWGKSGYQQQQEILGNTGYSNENSETVKKMK